MKYGTTIALTIVTLAAALIDGSLLELQRGGPVWRLVTCHFTHWTHEQLAWDLLAFVVLGLACERRNRRAFQATLLASAVFIPLGVMLFAPHVIAYRGLSGLDSALFALILALELRRSRSWIVAACAAGFAAKIAFELYTSSTVFVSDLGAGVAPVPIAHLAGAVIAALIASTMNSCVRPSSFSPS